MTSTWKLCWMLVFLVASVLMSGIGARILTSATPTSSVGRAPYQNRAADPDDFEIEDKDCSSLCQDATVKPLCVARNTSLGDKKTVLNACVLRKVNCHYNDSFVKLLDKACP